MEKLGEASVGWPGGDEPSHPPRTVKTFNSSAGVQRTPSVC